LFANSPPSEGCPEGTGWSETSTQKPPRQASPATPPQEGKLEGIKRTPNLSPQIVQKITDGLGLRFVSDHEGDEWEHGESLKNGRKSVIAKERSDCGNLESDMQNEIATSCLRTPRNDENMLKPTINPLDILDYIYAILHSPTYRETYKEFLKIDFPKVPYPTDTEKFWALVKLGREIRLYHLLEHPNLAECDTHYKIRGSNIITTKIATKDFLVNDTKTHGKIMINDTQYFDNIPIIAWEFYIGGYQPAQKWLKDRHGRKLNYEDIQHYQKIIKSLSETHKLMQEIDMIFVV
jgi:hypothetical protein